MKFHDKNLGLLILSTEICVKINQKKKKDMFRIYDTPFHLKCIDFHSII